MRNMINKRPGPLPLFFTTVSIQGAVVLSQFVAAFIVTPNEIGVIRTIESAISVLVLLTGLGAQVIAVRDGAAETMVDLQAAVLRDTMGILMVGAGCLAVFLVRVDYFNFSGTAIGSYLFFH